MFDYVIIMSLLWLKKCWGENNFFFEIKPISEKNSKHFMICTTISFHFIYNLCVSRIFILFLLILQQLIVMKGYISLYFLRASNHFNIPYFKILSHYVHASSWKIKFLELEKGMKIEIFLNLRRLFHFITVLVILDSYLLLLLNVRTYEPVHYIFHIF